MHRAVVFPRVVRPAKNIFLTPSPLSRVHRIRPVSVRSATESWQQYCPDDIIAEPDLTPKRVALIQSSFASVVDMTAPGLVGKSDEYFPQRFYELLFGYYPTLRPLFKHPKTQPRMLFSMLQKSTNLLDKDMTALVEDLKKLGERHHNYGTELSHYSAVGNTLIRVLQEALGDDMDEETTEAWKHLYGFMCQVMMPITAEMIEADRAAQKST